MNIVFVFIKSSFCPTHIPDVCFKILLQKKKLKVICRRNVKYVCAKFLLKIGKLKNVRYLSHPSSHRLYLMFILNSFCRRKNHKNLRVHPERTVNRGTGTVPLESILYGWAISPRCIWFRGTVSLCCILDGFNVLPFRIATTITTTTNSITI